MRNRIKRIWCGYKDNHLVCRSGSRALSRPCEQKRPFRSSLRNPLDSPQIIFPPFFRPYFPPNKLSPGTYVRVEEKVQNVRSLCFRYSSDTSVQIFRNRKKGIVFDVIVGEQAGLFASSFFNVSHCSGSYCTHHSVPIRLESNVLSSESEHFRVIRPKSFNMDILGQFDPEVQKYF